MSRSATRLKMSAPLTGPGETAPSQDNCLEFIDEQTLSYGLAHTPMDQHVIWIGGAGTFRPGSANARVLALITDPWRPAPLRELILKAARIDGSRGLPPELVRKAIRMHQRALAPTHLLVRRTAGGDFVTEVEIWCPTSRRRLPAGHVVLAQSQMGRSLDARAVN